MKSEGRASIVLSIYLCAARKKNDKNMDRLKQWSWLIERWTVSIASFFFLSEGGG